MEGVAQKKRMIFVDLQDVDLIKRVNKEIRARKKSFKHLRSVKLVKESMIDKDLPLKLFGILR